jgi:hypothetical protein
MSTSSLRSVRGSPPARHASRKLGRASEVGSFFSLTFLESAVRFRKLCEVAGWTPGGAPPGGPGRRCRVPKVRCGPGAGRGVDLGELRQRLRTRPGRSRRRHAPAPAATRVRGQVASRNAPVGARQPARARDARGLRRRHRPRQAVSPADAAAVQRLPPSAALRDPSRVRRIPSSWRSRRGIRSTRNSATGGALKEVWGEESIGDLARVP